MCVVLLFGSLYGVVVHLLFTISLYFMKKCRKKSQLHHVCRSFSRPRQSIETIIVVAKTTEKICAHFAHLNASRFHYLLKLHFCFLQAFELTKHKIQAHLMYDKSHLSLDGEQLSDRQLRMREAFKMFYCCCLPKRVHICFDTFDTLLVGL